MQAGAQRLLLIAAAAAVIGCERTAEPAASAAAGPVLEQAAPPPRADAPLGIEWHAGSVDSAFARAADEGRPVLLFWGAVWCPYCADLKAHVFTRRDFQQRLEQFVPVYLDGDDAGAQRWGDALGVAGYPTVLALAPDRTELARIAGGMEAEVYAEMLDLVLADVRPIGELLAFVRDTAEPLSREACRRLAYNGWTLDDAPAASRAGVLANAARRCPSGARVERARLTAFAAAFAVTEEHASIDTGAVPSPLLTDLLAQVRALVADRAAATAVADALQALGSEFFRVVRRVETPADAARLLEHWSAAMRAAAAEPGFTEGDRLLAIRSLVTAVRELGDGEVPPALAVEARAQIDAALDRTAGTPAYAGAVNAAVNVLLALRELERAYSISTDALRTSRTPYYHMADLALLAEQMGRDDEAIEWLERAYRESRGAATRFQWGTNFVRGLIRLRPDDEAAVREAAIAVLGELEGADRLYRRTSGRLATLDAALREWSATDAHDATIAAIRARMEEVCGGIPAEEPQALADCRAFLTADAA